ncbi:MAG: DUF4392 domain-containing protein [Synergistes sp.]|nr:DUF4392 domain-containing protein [Synergistes sp.]
MTDKFLSEDFVKRLLAVVSADRGGRGVSKLSEPLEWQNAAAKFSVLKNIAVVSGFYVMDANAPETDGPSGAVVLARAYLKAGRRSEVWTDAPCIEVMRSAARALSYPEEFVNIAPRSLKDTNIDGLIFTERVGRAADGRYYNFKREDMSGVSAPLDGFCYEAKRFGIPTLGIGDGGNETGMGKLSDKLKYLLPDYAACISEVPTDYVFAVDVSNWGAYAFSAMLSHLWGKWVGIDTAEEMAVLKAITENGAVDGITKLSCCTVDGFEIDIQNAIISELHDIYEKQCRVLR